MTMQKNHEEEVQLRLKFESKLNTLNTDYRELQISYKRTMISLGKTSNELEALKVVSQD